MKKVSKLPLFYSDYKQDYQSCQIRIYFLHERKKTQKSIKACMQLNKITILIVKKKQFAKPKIIGQSRTAKKHENFSVIK